MAMQAFADHLLGNWLIVIVFGSGTLGCFAAALWMLVRPGETSRDHPKYRILRDDR